tara:strand:+ start:6623 stop:10336 length:3714 start_codon:yes stop_codon:yes gene_type:complete
MATVRVPIMNLFSGVARQPSSKRLTSELQNIENAILTLERSAEKRPPLEFIHGGGAGGFLDNSLFISDAATAPVDDVAYFFFDKNINERYIIIVNRSVAHGSEDLIKIFKFMDVGSNTTPSESSPMVESQKVRTGDCVIERVFEGTNTYDQSIVWDKVDGSLTGYPDYTDINMYYPDNTAEGDNPDGTPWDDTRVDDIWEYVKWNPNGKPARDCLKATFFGNAMMILNKEVPATTWTWADMSPDSSSTPSSYNSPSTHELGRKLTYRIAAAPDKTGDYVMGGDFNPDTDQHEPVGGCSGSHPISLFKGADGNGTIDISDFQMNVVSGSTATSYGLGTCLLSQENVTTLGGLITALNDMQVTTHDVAADETVTINISTFLGTGATDAFSLATENGANTGQIQVDVGTDIVQFFDGNGNTATHLGFSGTTSVFDAARKLGKNLQPYLADADAANDGADTGAAGDYDESTAPVNSFGGAISGSIKVYDHSGGNNTYSLSGDNWGQLRYNIIDASDGKYTLTLNSTKDGMFLVYGPNGSTIGGVEGTLPVKVEEVSGGDIAQRLGILYDIGMHTPVRDDKRTSADLFERELGQNISSFNAIEIPPEGDDVNRVNGEEEATKFLYERTGIGNSDGYGKVWYCRSGFLTFPQGFYRCTSNDTIPHYDRVRAEDEHSVLYEASLPFLVINTGNNSWSVEYPEWKPREAGNDRNNPGPQAFQPDSANRVRGRQISDIAFWRERLWFTVDDMVFSSRNNDWFNVWLDDPNSITADDPIDIRASSGKYTRINFMIPFDDFMFINTGGETQYELQGSNNIISPTTAELAPTSFYSASSIVEPLVLGTQIYWFDDERLYLYNSSAGASVNNATEVSIHAAGYLPKNFRCAAVAPAQDSIFVVDEDNPNELYVYTARWAGGELAQNAFYKYVLPQTIVDRQITDNGGSQHGWDAAPYWDGNKTTLPKPEIEYVWYSRNYLYMIVLRPAYVGTKRQRFIERTSLQFLDINSPRLERIAEIPNSHVTGHVNDTAAQDETWFAANTTYWRLPYWDPSADEIILGPDWPTQAGQRLAETATVTNTDESDSGCTVLSVSGDWNSVSGTPYTSRAGSPYTMKLELSQVNYRDPSTGYPVEGTLALRMMNIKHFKSGVYDVEIVRNKNRVNLGSTDTDGDGNKNAVTVTTHTPLTINNSTDALGSLLVEEEGEFTTRVFGNADTTTITITSDYPSPVAITSLEIIGKFKPYNSSIQS